MSRLVKGRSIKSGLPPGSLVHIGEKKRDNTRITVFVYDENHTEVIDLGKAGNLASISKIPGNKWINVDGIHQIDEMEKIGKIFNLHPLVMEDILNTEQRPKLEDYSDYIYIVVKMIYYESINSSANELITEQVSIITGKDYVLTFQENEGDVFGSLRERLKTGTGRLHNAGSDYLAYALLDAIVDNYFIVMEKLGEKIEIADAPLVKPSPDTLQVIHQLKRALLYLHKAVWPLREVLGSLERGDSALVKDSTVVYIRDVYDHVIQIMDTIETYRDIISGMLEIYLSGISNRMNEVMKVLTIISTLFIPLTFVVGIYGMNFKYMPELNKAWGYPAVLFLMVVIVLVMVYYFKKKKWI